MDKIDLGIAFDAYDDFDEVYNQFREIIVKTGKTDNDAITDLNNRLVRLRKLIPINLFQSQSVYGEMQKIPFKHLEIEELQTFKKELAGPPYYYLHCEPSKEVKEIYEGLDIRLSSILDD